MFILSPDFLDLNDLDELNRRWNAYREYLHSIADRLPRSAREFAHAGWHYDHADSRSLHDSWVESLAISELSSGERREVRSVEIVVKLIGPYHDGLTTLRHKSVASYSLSHSSPVRAGHGDWLQDEVRISESGLVVHEIEFRNDGHWIIECGDIDWEWNPGASRQAPGSSD
jgi:hypothetical protein